MGQDPKMTAEDLQLGKNSSLLLQRIEMGNKFVEKATDGSRLFTRGHDMRMRDKQAERSSNLI